MIKAFFFDYDGVLTLHETGSYSTCSYLSRKLDMDLPALLHEYRKFNRDLLLGKKTHKEIWDTLCSNLQRRIDYSLLIEAFKSTPPNREIHDLVKELKRNYRTALITDNKKDRMEVLIPEHKLRDLFDLILISAELGSDKKYEAIFLKALEESDCKAHQAIFIDNRPENLIVPGQLGIRTVYFDFSSESAGGLKNKIRKIFDNPG